MNKNSAMGILLLTLLLTSLALARAPVFGQSQQFSAPALDWQKEYGSPYAAWIGQVQNEEYAFFVPGADEEPYRNFFQFATLTAIDSSGTVEWTKDFGPPFPGEIISTNDGFLYTTVNDSLLTLNKLDVSGETQWNQTLSNAISGSPMIIQTADGGYTVAIQNHTELPHYVDVSALLIIKTNAQGITKWVTTTKTVNNDYTLRSFIQTKDGGYALAGSFQGPSGLNGADFCLVKLNSEGNLQWTKTYGGALDDNANAVVQTNDGGYALAGDTYSFGAGGSDALIVKTDASGNVEWARTYGGAGQKVDIQGQTNFLGQPIADASLTMPQPSGSLDDHACCLVQTVDGGLAFAGTTAWSSPTTANLIWLVKTDANGVEEWNQTYANFESVYVYADRINWG